MSTKSSRSYTSPLRDEQARQTQDRILDGLTALLSERRADEISTREIAERSGVSQPTVYRHFPDREALLLGLADRGEQKTAGIRRMDATSAPDEFATMMASLFEASEGFAVEATAEALLNADPRRFTGDTRRHSSALGTTIDAEFTQLSEAERAKLTGLLRCIGSAQTWLRMREEFGVSGDESGPVVAWAIQTLLAEARAGNFPPD